MVANLKIYTSTVEPPRYYSHFILAQTKAQSVILKKNPLIRPDFCGPLHVDRINGVPL